MFLPSDWESGVAVEMEKGSTATEGMRDGLSLRGGLFHSTAAIHAKITTTPLTAHIPSLEIERVLTRSRVRISLASDARAAGSGSRHRLSTAFHATVFWSRLLAAKSILAQISCGDRSSGRSLSPVIAS